MQEVTVTFDRVFDVVRDGTLYRQQGVLFSFESVDRKEYGVLLLGNPVLSNGMTVTAILKWQDNWQTLICFRNHQTGEIVFGGRVPPPSYIFWMILIGTVATVGLIATFQQSPWLAVLGAVVPTAYLVGQGIEIRCALVARALLKKSMLVR